MTYRIKIRSRHPSHNVLRRNLPSLPMKSVVRLGSIAELPGIQVEINTVNSIKISSNKKLMKEYFDKAGVSTAPWIHVRNLEELVTRVQEEDSEVKFPIIAKSFFGSRGIGNYKLDSLNELNNWARHKDVTDYIFEKYMTYKLEYRLHVSKLGCFYACRKALAKDAENAWQRHSDNCVWYLETNLEKFQKPNSWNRIIEDCKKALNEIGADILSFDVKVQSALDKNGNQRQEQKFILLESNSASSLGNPNGEGLSICAQKYIEFLPKLIMYKANL